MKTNLKLSLIASLLVAAGAAYSQSPMGEQCGPAVGPGMEMRHDRMSEMDPARMQAMMEKRDALLKAQLKLTPAQEGAWKAFVEARMPAAAPAKMQRPDPIEMAKLTTPERLDKMKVMHEERMTAMTEIMAKRDAAVRVFYAELTPAQQKVFDAVSLPGQGRAHGGRMAPPPAPDAKL
jgi:periplasmic protein CpxP/Spy